MTQPVVTTSVQAAPAPAPAPAPASTPASTRRVAVQYPDLATGELGDELWREYDWTGRVYRIENPVRLYYRPGGSTHRVLDAEGIVHCVPAPGSLGCVLRWKPQDADNPVQW